MAILKLKPACKDYIWGGRRLIEEYGIRTEKTRAAEAWVLSAHPDGESKVIGEDITLSEYIKRGGKKILGTNCEGLKEFPLLVKLIDARENLSVQVHPTNEYALANENQMGKVEMWYVIDAEEDARLYCGFNRKVTREEFINRIENNTLMEILNAIKVKRGDIIYVPAGTVHAIGKGVLVAEIQQNSNVSYRIYDYGRNRPLHIDKALDVTNLERFKNRDESYPHVVACEYFVVDRINLDGKILTEARGTVDEKSFMGVLILDGLGTISGGGESFSYRKGDTFFLPADSGEWTIDGNCDALLVTVPESHGKNI
ncbi:MAG: mannose-6-phosphate isomerase [Selenomonadaceae bacterium]|nr:mannose-6-phosphate isomerase [Selenomonadaceae bacterium]